MMEKARADLAKVKQQVKDMMQKEDRMMSELKASQAENEELKQ